jgi:pyruvate,water dikinase
LRGETRYPQIVSVIFKFFWKTAAYFMGIKDYSLFSFFTPLEIGELLENPSKYKDKLAEINKRKVLCMFWGDPQTDLIVFEYRREVIAKINKINMFKGAKEIKGKIAFKGCIQGRVYIINKPEDIKNFKKGEIIASINTSPSLMSALLKCGGIITNEGGIMCHASIISRELKKPCIIGTKIATQVLKNGDLIELDANKGVIKILKQ